MKRYRLLRPDEIECRVSTCKENGVSLLLYKTARTDADLLDETVGADRWENDFKLVDGVLYGGIGVDYGDGHMVWKWDAGTESNTEAEKGRASDAFKRAGFKHGIGRELYSSPFIWIPASFCKIQKGRNGKPACYDEFEVAEIGYDGAERVNALRITLKGKTVYELGKFQPKPEPEPEPENVLSGVCADCGQPILDAKRRDGTIWPAGEIAEYTKLKFDRPLCASCGKAAAKVER